MCRFCESVNEPGIECVAQRRAAQKPVRLQRSSLVTQCRGKWGGGDLFSRGTDSVTANDTCVVWHDEITCSKDCACFFVFFCTWCFKLPYPIAASTDTDADLGESG